MPTEVELPSSPLLVRLFAESPWTLALPLLIAAAALGWWGARNDRVKPLLIAIGLLLAAAGTLGLAALRTSAGEHAAATVRALVAAAEAADTAALASTFAPDASMHYGGPQSPGDNLDALLRAANSLTLRHRIERNTITELDYATLDEETGVVLLGCLTETAASFGPVPTRWYFVVRRTSEDRWLIERIAWLRLLNQPPPRNF